MRWKGSVGVESKDVLFYSGSAERIATSSHINFYRFRHSISHNVLSPHLEQQQCSYSYINITSFTANARSNISQVCPTPLLGLYFPFPFLTFVCSSFTSSPPELL